MLEAVEITAGYGRKNILASLSMRAEPGAITVLVGPNGSGKSTLLRCLAGALRPLRGVITIEEQNLYRISARRASGLITYVSQETAMPFAFTVGELVRLGGAAGGDREAMDEAILLLDLQRVIGSSLNTLSGGEQQRASIARGLTQKTPYLLLDEPTAHLDLRYQSALFQALRNRAHEHRVAVVVVLHDLVLAARYADKIILLNNGVIEKEGPVLEVITEETIEKVYKVRATIRRHGSEIVGIAPLDDLTFS